MKSEFPESPDPAPAGKLSGKVALINDASTALGQAVANLFACEGAEVVLACMDEESEAAKIRQDERCLLMSGDAADVAYCINAVERTLLEYGALDIRDWTISQKSRISNLHAGVL